MDSYTLSQAFGASTILVQLGGSYLQSKFPDAKNLRFVSIPVNAFSSMSYGFQGKILPAVDYGLAVLRTSVRSSRWGTEHKKLVSGTATLAMAGATSIFYEKPADALPLIGFGMGSLMDYQKQGRYVRPIFWSGILGITAPMAYLNDNPAMLVAESTRAILIGKSIYEFDIKNAAGPDKSFAQNFKAYLHGIFKGSATGASKEGQTSLDADSNTVEQQWNALRKTNPNPYFTEIAQPQAHI